MEKLLFSSLLILPLLLIPASLSAQTPQPCSNYYQPGVPIPAGYGAASDLLGTGALEVQASCDLCAWSGTVWKCGCADPTCTTGYWQLQAFKAGAQTTITSSTTPTANTTTGNTTFNTTGNTPGQSCGQCDVTITVKPGAVQRFGGLGFNALPATPLSDGSWPTIWPMISSSAWTEIFHQLFSPGHFVAMRLFGYRDGGESALQSAKQQGMTDLVLLGDSCNDDYNTVGDQATQLRSAGVPVTAVSVGNKPNAENQNHCARRSETTVANEVKDGRQALDARGLQDVLVLGPETVEWSPISQEEYGRYTFQTGDSMLYLSAIGNDSAALAALGAFSTQSYGTAVTTEMQNYAQQHGKPYWVTMSVEPWYDSGQAYQPADSVSVATLLSDLNHGASKWFYWTWAHLVNVDGIAQNGGAVHMNSLYDNLSNVSGAFDVGAMVRRSESNPALPTADMHFNYGQEPEITAAAAKNPDGSWAIALVNLTGVHAMLLNDATYDTSAAHDRTVRVYVEELTNAGNLTFHKRSTISGSASSVFNGPGIAMTNGYLTVVVHPLETVTLISR